MLINYLQVIENREHKYLSIIKVYNYSIVINIIGLHQNVKIIQ
jgi:hypothetical protein